ncbi:MAG: transcriptional regulator [Planctomycetes bacterium]|nr:transcriptional regulator [Planctomycetota bacterium]
MSARSAKPDKQADGRFAYEGLERAIHEKARLGILTSLAAHPQGLLFNDLKELCSLTDGNLNRHLAVLEEAGLIDSTRLAKGGRPQTRIVMTPSGRRRFEQYISVLEQVVADALSSQQQATAAAKSSKLSRGWSPA